ncbi:MAG: hypothetical protein ACPG8A_02995 [Psychrobium sp.]
MSLELTPLQQHCLAGIGIPQFQSRLKLASMTTEIETEVEQATAEQLSMNQVEAPATQVAEAQASYNKPAYQAPANLLSQLETVLSYVAKATSQQSIAWQVNVEANAIQWCDNELKLPPLETVFSTPSLKKSLWNLLSELSNEQ